MKSRLLPALFAPLLFALGACGADDGATKDPTDGAVIYQQALCASCHGSAGKGGWMGPPLKELGEHWSRETLADFIRDPAKFVDDDQRLSELSRQFPTQMAPQKTLTKAQRLAVADWLLAR